MELDTVQILLGIAATALVTFLGWLVRKIFSVQAKATQDCGEMENKIAVLEASCSERAKAREAARKELMDAINTHNGNVMTRLTSIEEYLRNGRASRGS